MDNSQTLELQIQSKSQQLLITWGRQAYTGRDKSRKSRCRTGRCLIPAVTEPQDERNDDDLDS